MQTTFSLNKPLPYCVLVGVCVLHALMIAWLIKTTPTPLVLPPSKVLSVEFINIAPQKINSPLTTSEQRPTKPTPAKDTHKTKKTEVKKTEVKNPQAKAHTPPAPTPPAKTVAPVLATQKSQSTITASTPKSDIPPVKEEVKPIQNLSDQPKQATPKPETVRQEAKQETPKQETLVQKNTHQDTTEQKTTTQDNAQTTDTAKHQATQSNNTAKAGQKDDSNHQQKGGGGSPNTKSEQDWQSKVRLLLQKRLIYPEEALQKRQNGTAVVRIHLNSEGVVQKVDLVTSSGKSSLDNEAIAVVKRASPLPKPPDSLLTGGALTVNIPIKFDHKKHQ